MHILYKLKVLRGVVLIVNTNIFCKVGISMCVFQYF